jgi:uncharacterized protein
MPDTPSTKPEGPLGDGTGAPPPVQLTLDRDGNWFHDGQPILHPKLRRLLDRHLLVTDEGEVEVRVGNGDRVERALVTVEELPYQVRDIEVSAKDNDAGTLFVVLNDESREEITPDKLRVVGDDALYCFVKDGRYPARFLRSPYIRLASRFDEDGHGGFVLPLGGRRWPLTQQEEAPPWP